MPKQRESFGEYALKALKRAFVGEIYVARSGYDPEQRFNFLTRGRVTEELNGPFRNSIEFGNGLEIPLGPIGAVLAPFTSALEAGGLIPTFTARGKAGEEMRKLEASNKDENVVFSVVKHLRNQIPPHIPVHTPEISNDANDPTIASSRTFEVPTQPSGGGDGLVEYYDTKEIT